MIYFSREPFIIKNPLKTWIQIKFYDWGSLTSTGVKEKKSEVVWKYKGFGCINVIFTD